MISYTELPPHNGQLSPYIESYVALTINTPKIDTKVFLPRAGASLLLSNIPISLDNEVNDTSVMLGISSKSTLIKWKGTATGHGLVLKFSPYGLSRFTATSVPRMLNTSIAANKLFGNSFQKLHCQIMETDDVAGQIDLIEDYLAKRFREPDEIDHSIFGLADYIKAHDGYRSLKTLLHNIPLGRRQVERRFKELIGVNIQTFNRICHFDHAKALLIAQQSSCLTDIGYQSGYFDQAHFNREFKRFATYSPKSFFENAPFYRLISHLKK